ncbi:hypothetical protein LSUE1_G006937 [Lachnellula suecica]|uniref:2EXR domain-containing protein n=1 Tax=Lachnellula suecica TaxID=602035 RepID=A0A8T9C256_9HELO|nr:hypothetical protein LSUE1_G006937 [Lachnellula suecica]
MPSASTTQESESAVDSVVDIDPSPDPPPKEWKPFLTSFALFSKFPIEIRQMIWYLTLQPRVVELAFQAEHGFYSRVRVPPALGVCSDSRRAVSHLYALRFGSALDEPAISFNFSLDTLYFDESFGAYLLRFLTLLKDEELKQIRYLAIDSDIKELSYTNHRYYDHDHFNALRKVANIMPELKELLIVNVLNEIYHDHGVPVGSGTMQLYEEFPREIYRWVRDEGFHEDDDDLSACPLYFSAEDLVDGLNAEKIGSVWGWRSTELEGIGPPGWG